MAGGSIKVFQFIQKYYQAVGIFPSPSNQKCVTFHWRYAIILICLAQFLVSIGAFLFFEAELMVDIGLGIFIVIASIDGIILFTIQIWQIKNSLKYIETCEEFIERRK